jgi:energy-converting hydrogenase Eha subunit A
MKRKVDSAPKNPDIELTGLQNEYTSLVNLLAEMKGKDLNEAEQKTYDEAVIYEQELAQKIAGFESTLKTGKDKKISENQAEIDEKNNRIGEIDKKLGEQAEKKEGAEKKPEENEKDLEGETPLEKMRKDIDVKRDEYLGQLGNYNKEKKTWQGFNKKTLAGAARNFLQYLTITKEEKFIKAKYPNLESSKSDYDKARVLYANELIALKEADIRKRGNLSEEEIKALIENYRDTDIYDEVHVREYQKLKDAQAERFPPKKKTVWGTIASGYEKFTKLSKIQRAAITTVVFATPAIALGVVGAAGIPLYLGYRFARGLASSAVVGVVTNMMKEYQERAMGEFVAQSELKKQDYKSQFKTGEMDVEKYEKELGIIQAAIERKQRRQMLARLGAGILVGAGTSMTLSNLEAGSNIDSMWKSGHGEAAGGGTPEQSGADDGGITGEKMVVHPFEVPASENGALQTVLDLKKALTSQFPDPSLAPANIQHILNTDHIELTKEFGLYDPNAVNGNESAMMLSGSTVEVGPDGTITLHNFGKGDTILSSLKEGEAIKYHDQMFDANRTVHNMPNKVAGVNAEIDISKSPEMNSVGEININKVPDINGGGEIVINKIPDGVEPDRAEIDINKIPKGTVPYDPNQVKFGTSGETSSTGQTATSEQTSGYHNTNNEDGDAYRSTSKYGDSKANSVNDGMDAATRAELAARAKLAGYEKMGSQYAPKNLQAEHTQPEGPRETSNGGYRRTGGYRSTNGGYDLPRIPRGGGIPHDNIPDGGDQGGAPEDYPQGKVIPNFTPEEMQHQRVNSAVDAIFGEDKFGRHVIGTDTNEWDRLKDWKMNNIEDKNHWFPIANRNDAEAIKYIVDKTGISYMDGNGDALTLEEYLNKVEAKNPDPYSNESYVKYLLDTRPR